MPRGNDQLLQFSSFHSSKHRPPPPAACAAFGGCEPSAANAGAASLGRLPPSDGLPWPGGCSALSDGCVPCGRLCPGAVFPPFGAFALGRSSSRGLHCRVILPVLSTSVAQRSPRAAKLRKLTMRAFSMHPSFDPTLRPFGASACRSACARRFSAISPFSAEKLRLRTIS